MSAGAIDPTKVAPSAVAAGPRRTARGTEIGCRILDLCVAVTVLALAAPLLLVIAAAIALESPGPVLFRQRRLGQGLEPFVLNKFRTMRTGVSQEVHRDFVVGLIAGEAPPSAQGKANFKLAEDPRVTRVGNFLRRWSLDELPQLWNVVRGEMSLVGPRPPIAYEVEHYPAHWFARFAVKPGVTGLWQVSGRSELSLEQMIALDVEYSRRRTLLFNVWILIRTVPAVLSRRGAS